MCLAQWMEEKLDVKFLLIIFLMSVSPLGGMTDTVSDTEHCVR
jgi:hypothetical protein